MTADMTAGEFRYPDPDASEAWTAAAVRELREHLGLSQQELARRIGTRQQTISEWETGTRAPRRMSRRLLHLVAEESGFYAVPDPPGPDGAARPHAAGQEPS